MTALEKSLRKRVLELTDSNRKLRQTLQDALEAADAPPKVVVMAENLMDTAEEKDHRWEKEIADF